MSSSLVTVLMPVYNGAAFLSETIDSILNQTFHDFEFLIVNDGSTDESEKIILSYDDERIKYLKNEANIGIIASLNRGLDIIKSKYIIRMDADDLCLPHRIGTQVDFMEKNPEIVLSGSGKINFTQGKNGEENEIIPIVDQKILYFKSIFNTCIPHPSAIIRNDVIQKHNIRYDATYYGAEDKAMWLDLAKYGKLGNIKIPLIKYRAHDNQISYTKIEDCRRSSVAKTFEVLKAYGFDISGNDVEALKLICYPGNCKEIRILYETQKLADKLCTGFKEMDLCDPSYMDDFFKMRIKRILVWSTPVGLSLIKFIYKSNNLKLREFGYTFYKKTIKREIK